MHADGYIQLKDRSKDIIISGGENISSIEVEDTLYKHPAVAAVAVVAKPDDKWGETPCAFIELRRPVTVRSRTSSTTAARTWPATRCRARRVHRAAEDLDRQDPEVQAARHGEGRLIYNHLPYPHLPLIFWPYWTAEECLGSTTGSTASSPILGTGHRPHLLRPRIEHTPLLVHLRCQLVDATHPGGRA
jgi:acyl-CoA synthetase (AMP-forming)/AMP-acid ligase II